MAKPDARQQALSREQSKTRVLIIAKMLYEGRVLNAKEIQRRLLMQYDMKANRKTIYSDIYAIDKVMPIEVVNGVQGGFRKWEVVDG